MLTGITLVNVTRRNLKEMIERETAALAAMVNKNSPAATYREGLISGWTFALRMLDLTVERMEETLDKQEVG